MRWKQIQECARKGMSMRQTAKELGISITTVSTTANRHNIRFAHESTAITLPKLPWEDSCEVQAIP